MFAIQDQEDSANDNNGDQFFDVVVGSLFFVLSNNE